MQNIYSGFFFSGFVDLAEFRAPEFCHECGAPYPWTKAKIEAANEFVDDLDELDENEKSNFKKSIDEIVKNSPKSEMAVHKIGKLMKKLGQGAYIGARKLLVDISSETLKKLIESTISLTP